MSDGGRLNVIGMAQRMVAASVTVVEPFIIHTPVPVKYLRYNQFHSLSGVLQQPQGLCVWQIQQGRAIYGKYLFGINTFWIQWMHGYGEAEANGLNNLLKEKLCFRIAIIIVEQT